MAAVPLSDEESSRHELMKTVAAATSSGLSIIGAIYILGRYWYARRVKTSGLAANGNSSTHHLDVTKELIHVLAWLDLVGALGRIFGVAPTQTFDQTKGEHVTNICELQAVVITFGDVSPIAWNLVMAFNLFRWICMGEDQQMLQQRIKWYILGTLVFTFTIAFVALGFGKYGDAGLWCWIVIPGAAHHEEELWWKLGCLYFWVLAGGATMCWLLVLVKRDMKTRLASYENEDAREAYDGVVHNLTIYIGAFIVCWLPAVVDRGYSAITSEDVFTLSMLHASIVPLQGFVNAVIYGKFHIWIVRHVHNGTNGTIGGPASSFGKASARLSPTSSDACVRRSAMLREQSRQHFGTATVFITTFDMNWSASPTNLEDWIPAGKDLYVFSLQHCVNVQAIEQAIRKYLLRTNYPIAYRSITSLAGSSLRGAVQDASVCQIVFVNNADDASGNFQFHAADGRTWSQRKTFKEVVGIPIRYFDASIAFVSCNLSPSDVDRTGSGTGIDSSRGYRATLEKHAVATRLIHSFGMDADRAAVDFPNLYHHTFLSGNLNYDIDLPSTNVLGLVDQAYKAACLKQATDAAIEPKLLRSRGNGGSAAGAGPTYRQSLDRGLTREGHASSPTSTTVTTISDAQNANVNVEWNVLYFTSRNSLGRSSNVSTSTDDATGVVDDDVVYHELYSSTDDALPFTLLQSPQPAGTAMTTEPFGCTDLRHTTVPESDVGFLDANDVHIAIDGNSDQPRRSTSWRSFLEGLFPTAATATTTQSQAPTTDRTSSASASAARRSTVSNRVGSLGNSTNGNSTGPGGKKMHDLLAKSELVAQNSVRKWKELLRFDELRAAMEAKEVFCGFDEPPIRFLPSFPRRVGTAASFASVAERSCRDIFVSGDTDDDDDNVVTAAPPAYKDRVLAHSLQDAKQRLRNVAYWLCEDIATSTHKPVCSVYELEIDRFFSYKMDEAAHRDCEHGRHALRDKTGVHEFKLKLVNLDANIWTAEAPRDTGLLSASTHSASHPFRGRRAATPIARSMSSGSNSRGGGGGNDSATSSTPSDSVASQQLSHSHSQSTLTKKRSVAQLVDRVLLRKDRGRSSTAASTSRSGATTVAQSGTPNPYSDFSSDARGSHPLAVAAGDRLSALSTFQLELVPVEPVSISTVFPLPSEDVYALQRKVYEVAHSVQSGFQSSARDDDAEESLLAFTNCRTVAWQDASVQGVAHTAITKAVNGVVHIAVTIKAEKGHGGQGVLCIQESDLLQHATPVFSDAHAIPFDVTLTWGGKHVGYLHGDILSCL